LASATVAQQCRPARLNHLRSAQPLIEPGSMPSAAVVVGSVGIGETSCTTWQLDADEVMHLLHIQRRMELNCSPQVQTQQLPHRGVRNRPSSPRSVTMRRYLHNT
jgi:hypothetical protein